MSPCHLHRNPFLLETGFAFATGPYIEHTRSVQALIPGRGTPAWSLLLMLSPQGFLLYLWQGCTLNHSFSVSSGLRVEEEETNGKAKAWRATLYNYQPQSAGSILSSSSESGAYGERRFCPTMLHSCLVTRLHRFCHGVGQGHSRNTGVGSRLELPPSSCDTRKTKIGLSGRKCPGRSRRSEPMGR